MSHVVTLAQGAQEGTHFRWGFDPPGEAACGATGVAFVDQDKATCRACLDTEIPF